MKVHQRVYKQGRIGIVLLTFIVVQIACIENVSPEDRTVNRAFTDMSGLWTEHFMWPMLGVRREVSIPRITQCDLSLKTCSGLQSIDSNETVEVAINEVMPDGCSRSLKKIRPLSEPATVNEYGEWTVSAIEIPPDALLISASATKQYRESALGNVIVINPDAIKPTILTPTDAVQIDQSVSFTGKGIPGLCFEVWRGDQRTAKDVEIGANGEWSLPYSIPLSPGENKFELLVKNPGIDLDAAVYTITRTSLVRLVWPFGDHKNGVYEPDPSKGCITGWYGPNDFYVKKKYGNHNGLDIGGCGDNIKGIPVRAVADGVVHRIQLDPTGKSTKEGNAIVIDHGSWATVYLHLDRVDMEGKGIHVSQGKVIGTVGRTGIWADGVHLHLGAFRWSDVLNKPADVLVPGTASRINLNRQDLEICASPENYWDLDWSQVYVANDDGTNFTMKSCDSK